MKTLILVAALIVGAHPTSAATSGIAIAKAFDEGCLPHDTELTTSNKRALDLGWVKAPEDSDPELAKVMAGAALDREHPDKTDWQFEVSIFKKQTEGRQFYLVKERNVVPGKNKRLACYVYDFAATEPVKPDALSRLLGRKYKVSTLDEKSKSYLSPKLLVSYEWKAETGIFDTQLLFVPQTSPLVIKTGFSGLLIQSIVGERFSGKPQ